MSDRQPARPNKRRIRRGLLNAYINLNAGIWRRLPRSVTSGAVGQWYGRHLHWAVRQCADRQQYFGTFFLRNRAELELMRSLVGRFGGRRIEVTVLACSKGAEVYSIVSALRTARPELKLSIHAVDISPEILEFAERGVYSLAYPEASSTPNSYSAAAADAITRGTCQDQNAPIFERMTRGEIEAMGEVDGEQMRIRPWLREGIRWLHGDALDPELVDALGPQDIVVANRFLCHMEPPTAERCLRNVGRLVRSGGYLFVSGVDLDVRTRVAREQGWAPVSELRREIHEGDTSLRRGWPLQYWGLEPYREGRDAALRYTSVFRIGQPGGR